MVMCGRFALGIPKKRLEEVFGLAAPDDYAPRYNVAPGLDVLAVVFAGGVPRMARFRWGLIPAWADDPKVGYKKINARSENVFDKPSFRESVRCSRCLVPVQAFYEWRRQGRARQPFAFGPEDADLFAMAGIAARWQDPATGGAVDSLAVLTCPPNELMAPIHDRMPVILSPDAWSGWLDSAETSPENLAPLLVPYPARSMRVWPVNPLVNSVANDGPELLERAGKPASRQGSLL